MAESTRLVGLDVHAREAACAVFDPASGEVQTRKVTGRSEAVLGWLDSLERPWRAVYEAGPTGYGLARRARARGLAIEVCAPGHIARHPSDRIKTDKRDALRLARLLAAGELKLIRVPEPEEEWLRDLVRAREDVRVDLTRTRNRISKFCLRRELYYPHSGSAWTRRHRDWLCSLQFQDKSSQLCFVDYLHAHDLLLARRERLEAALELAAAESPWAELVARLRCLRGIDTLSAVGLCAEVGDFARFRPKQLASYLGLVPCEDSSGERRRQGSITKAGSKHARRLLVEAAWHYKRPPRVSAKLRHRQQGQDPHAIELAWRCQERLYARWQRLERERGKRSTIACVAVARELATFCWELATLN